MSNRYVSDRAANSIRGAVDLVAVGLSVVVWFYKWAVLFVVAGVCFVVLNASILDRIWPASLHDQYRRAALWLVAVVLIAAFDGLKNVVKFLLRR